MSLCSWTYSYYILTFLNWAEVQIPCNKPFVFSVGAPRSEFAHSSKCPSIWPGLPIPIFTQRPTLLPARLQRPDHGTARSSLHSAFLPRLRPVQRNMWMIVCLAARTQAQHICSAFKSKTHTQHYIPVSPTSNHINQAVKGRLATVAALLRVALCVVTD